MIDNRCRYSYSLELRILSRDARGHSNTQNLPKQHCKTMNALRKIIRSYFPTWTHHVHYQHLHVPSDHEDEEEEILHSLSTEQILLTFRNITKVITEDNYSDWSKGTITIKRTLLHNISGSVHPGEILAVMGASGSGKTTLLDTLTNHSTFGVTGEILLNNQPYNHNQMKQKIAHVMQDEEFFSTLTVREQLIFIARLKLPWCSAEKYVKLLVRKLQLQRSKDLPIYLISHGEKKRLSIAVSLLTNPSILVLDEPTSGLDSALATSLIQLLRNLANEQKKTILLSIHQPSSQIFQTFDQVMLISEGKIIFMDKPQAAAPYFMSLGYQCPVHFNPADYMMHLVSESDSFARDRLAEEYIKVATYSEQEKEQFQNKKEILLPHITMSLCHHSFFQEFTVLYKRSLKLIIQRQLTRLYLIYTLFLILLTGLCWFRTPFRESTLLDRSSYIFFVLTLWSSEILVVTLFNFSAERRLINREQQESGLYRLPAYFLGKLSAEIPVVLTLPFIYLTVTYWMHNLNPYFLNYLNFLFIQLLALVISQALSLAVTSTIHDAAQALVTSLILLLAMVLFGGFYARNISPWISWLKYLSFIKYAYEACLQISFSNNLYFQCENAISMTKLCSRTSLNTTIFSGRDALMEYYGIREGQNFSLQTNTSVLVLLLVFFELLVFLALAFVKEKNIRQ